MHLTWVEGYSVSHSGTECIHALPSKTSAMYLKSQNIFTDPTLVCGIVLSESQKECHHGFHVVCASMSTVVCASMHGFLVVCIVVCAVVRAVVSAVVSGPMCAVVRFVVCVLCCVL